MLTLQLSFLLVVFLMGLMLLRFKGNAYYFSVDYNSINYKFDKSNIHKYLMT